MNRKLLAFIASGALALPMAAQAADVSVSGHINRALLFGDDVITGADSDVKHSDGGASPSRFRMTGSEELDGGMTAGVNLEYGVSGSFGAKDSPDEGDVATGPNLRQANVHFSGAFGKLTLGQASQATDGIAYSNFDNYAWAAGIEVGCDFCSGLPTYGGGRSEVVRYDTPSLGPATVGISGDGNDFFDAALRVDGDAGAGKYQLKAGYGNTDKKQKNFAMSGAFGLENGSHFNAAWGQTDPDMAGAEKLSYWHVGLGHNFGNSSVAATYTDHENKGGIKSWGIGVGHGMGGFEVYAGYKNLSFEVETAGTDHGFFVVGSRVKFN